MLSQPFLTMFLIWIMWMLGIVFDNTNPELDIVIGHCGPDYTDEARECRRDAVFYCRVFVNVSLDSFRACVTEDIQEARLCHTYIDKNYSDYSNCIIHKYTNLCVSPLAMDKEYCFNSNFPRDVLDSAGDCYLTYGDNWKECMSKYGVETIEPTLEDECAFLDVAFEEYQECIKN